MSKNDIIYFLSWGLEWLIPCEYEKDIKRVKEKMK